MCRTQRSTWRRKVKCTDSRICLSNQFQFIVDKNFPLPSTFITWSCLVVTSAKTINHYSFIFIKGHINISKICITLMWRLELLLFGKASRLWWWWWWYCSQLTNPNPHTKWPVERYFLKSVVPSQATERKTGNCPFSSILCCISNLLSNHTLTLQGLKSPSTSNVAISHRCEMLIDNVTPPP